MRGEFNKLLAVRFGPRSTAGPPGVTYAVGIPCRRVPQTRISQGQFDFTLATAWVTQDTVVFNKPAVSSPWLGAYFTDQLTADEVEFDDDPGVWWSVCRHEELFPFIGADYHRDLLIPVHRLAYPWWLPPSVLPTPPAPGPPLVVAPGDECSVSAALPGYGPWSISNAPGTPIGYYRFTIPNVGPWHLYVSGPSVALYHLVAQVVIPGTSCCGPGTPLQIISESGSHCITLVPLSGQTSGDVCLRFDHDDGSTTSGSMVITLAPGAC